MPDSLRLGRVHYFPQRDALARDACISSGGHILAVSRPMRSIVGTLAGASCVRSTSTGPGVARVRDFDVGDRLLCPPGGAEGPMMSVDRYCSAQRHPHSVVPTPTVAAG
jgi:hypothetical protein